MEMNNNNPPFSIGQRVVALRDSNATGAPKIKKGQELSVAGCVKMNCGCGWLVLIQEFPARDEKSRCGKCCGTVFHEGLFNFGGRHIYFAPIREVRDHKSIAVPEELLHIVERDTLEPLPVKTLTP
jgi:hypothetical protein